ncbi:hypothetical protein [Shewanella waksmanii]|uniref:hypothetical protein n=1 Tax=Shewanella waksmanii TaxID=213783 RepID=UPI0037369796
MILLSLKRILQVSTLNRGSWQQKQLNTKLEHTLDKEKLFKSIDADIQLSGAGIIYIDENMTVVKLREFQPVCRVEPVHIILREPPKFTSQNQFIGGLKHSASNVRESRLVSELVGTTLACGGAVLSWVVFSASTAATPITLGSSSVVSVLSLGAATATTAQCVNGIVRNGSEAFAPGVNDWLDSQDWYLTTVSALDYISLAGATASGAIALRTLKLAQANGVGLKQLLANKSRQQRKRITQEIIRMKVPNISGKMLKKMIKNGNVPKRFSNIEITNELRTRLRDSVAAAMAFTGSAFNGEVKGLAIGVYEGIRREY